MTRLVPSGSARSGTDGASRPDSIPVLPRGVAIFDALQRAVRDAGAPGGEGALVIEALTFGPRRAMVQVKARNAHLLDRLRTFLAGARRPAAGEPTGKSVVEAGAVEKLEDGRLRGSLVVRFRSPYEAVHAISGAAPPKAKLIDMAHLGRLATAARMTLRYASSERRDRDAALGVTTTYRDLQFGPTTVEALRRLVESVERAGSAVIALRYGPARADEPGAGPSRRVTKPTLRIGVVSPIER